MPLIADANRFKTKKSFKEAVKNGEDPFLSDPSIFNPISGRLSEILQSKEMITITNHPKRSWFASAKLSKDKSKIIVK